MKLATLKDGTRDGKLVVVSKDLTRYCAADNIAPTLQHALDNWAEIAPRLEALYTDVQHEAVPCERFHEREAHSPLPRAYQWADGSAYINHVELVRKARGAEVPESFYHATISIGESVSVAGQAREALSAVQREWDQGDGAHGAEHLGEASWRYAKASELVPWCPEIWYLRGLVTRKMGRFQQSIRHLVRMVKMDATHHHTWNVLGASLWYARLPKVAPGVTRQGELRFPVRTRGPRSRRRFARRCKARSEYLAELDL